MFAYCRNNPVCRIDISGGSDSPVTEQFDDDIEVERTLPEVGGCPSGDATSAVGSSGGSSSGGIQIVPSASGGNMTVDGTPSDEKTELHHIVEQCQTTKSGFSRVSIDGARNKVRIPQSVHRKISAHYSSKPNGPGTLRVRDMLAGLSFEEQYEYGMKILEQMWEEVFGK